MYKIEKNKEIFTVKAYIPVKNSVEEDFELNLVFDPGCAITLINTSQMDVLGYSAREDMIKKSTLTGAAGESRGYIIKIPTFTCMNQTLANFEIACLDLDSSLGVSGLLGMNFFKHFRMDIDFSNGIIHTILRIN